MSTAPFPRAVQPSIQPGVSYLPAELPQDRRALNLTTYRISKTHHGRTLQMLGHAAEYLANSRRFLIAESVSQADEEAVRILRRLSSSVFLEYAESVKVRRPVEDFVMGCAAWLFE
jgi:hypothetical protein